MNKSAFTMIELIFVIVIIGMLAAVAIPKLSATRTDAQAVAVVQEIHNAIEEVTGYVLTHGKKPNDYNLTEMSQTLKQLYEQKKARPANKNDPMDHMWIYTDKKKPIAHGCIDFATGSNNVRVEFEEKSNGPVCSEVRKILALDKQDKAGGGPKSIYYKISGTKVKF